MLRILRQQRIGRTQSRSRIVRKLRMQAAEAVQIFRIRDIAAAKKSIE